MSDILLAALARLLVVGTLGMLLLGLLRGPARRAMGAEAAYWLWLTLPAALVAVLLPRAPACLCGPATHIYPLVLRGLGAPLGLVSAIRITSCTQTVTCIWVIGFAAELAYFACCQKLMRRSLGPMQPRSDGGYYGAAAKHPMLVGTWRPKIVLPRDFEIRYSGDERAIILAHEWAHVERRDAFTNFIALVLVCLFWFNPFVYWAWNRFRFDQEVACDAHVLRRLQVPRRRYALALAKTHLMTSTATAFGWWQGTLIKRIAILSRPQPTRTRRMTGYGLALALMLAGTYVVWIAKPVSLAAGALITHM